MAPTDRRILIVSAVLFVVVTTVSSFLAPEPQDTSTVPTTYSSGASGALAAFLLLEDLGFDVQRWRRPPTELPREPAGTLLILAEPRTIGDGELRAIRQFLLDGGAVLATGSEATKVVPHWPEPEDEHGKPGTDCNAVHPSDATRGALTLSIAPRASFDGEAPQVVLYECAGRPGVAAVMLGKGRFLWWSGPTPLTNAGIKQAGNLAHFLNVVGAPGSVRILWDEYFHGHEGSLGSYLRGTPVPWGAAQAMLILFAAVLTHTRRAGAVVAPAPVSRHDPVEFVETVGGLYERAGARTTAVHIAHHRFRSLLARRGIPMRAGAAEVEKRLRSTTGRGAGIAGTLRECEGIFRGGTVEEWRALQLVQLLHEHAQQLGLIRASRA
ncbi:MAG TPA: DUF4350 domain-containing protein [Candidatus Polarisedimenticolia bacterium]|nr:DUF4350 domain-containing protein [Candidatus Polarisedimenticolia bacterium]